MHVLRGGVLGRCMFLVGSIRSRVSSRSSFSLRLLLTAPTLRYSVTGMRSTAPPTTALLSFYFFYCFRWCCSRRCLRKYPT